MKTRMQQMGMMLIKPSYNSVKQTQIMTNYLKLDVCNAFGLPQHADEVNPFITDNKIDVILISEIHFTNYELLQITKIHHV